jgi:hypothetical protein
LRALAPFSNDDGQHEDTHSQEHYPTEDRLGIHWSTRVEVRGFEPLPSELKALLLCQLSYTPLKELLIESANYMNSLEILITAPSGAPEEFPINYFGCIELFVPM